MSTLPATESTPLMSSFYSFVALGIDTSELSHQLATNWGLILLSGFINLFAGIFALFSPMAATVVAFWFLTAALIVAGSFNLFGVCFVEQCYRGASGFVGLFLVLLGFLMATNVVESLKVITVWIAIVFMVDGTYRMVLAMQNRDMKGWIGTLASGICSIAFSILVLTAMPASSTYTLGILLGVNLVTFGLFRISLGMIGRQLAHEQLEAAFITAPV